MKNYKNLKSKIFLSILDHHCPWISNCVGRRNRRIFVALCFFSSCLSIEIFILSIFKLNYVFKQSHPDHYRIALLIFFIVFCLIIGLAVLALFFLQFFLIVNGLTTNEYLRRAFQNTENPYHKGFYKNIREFFSYDASKKNVNFNYLKTKKKIEFAQNLAKTKLEDSETGKKFDFSLEMNVKQTIEGFKNDMGGSVDLCSNNMISMNKNLINQENNAL